MRERGEEGNGTSLLELMDDARVVQSGGEHLQQPLQLMGMELVVVADGSVLDVRVAHLLDTVKEGVLIVAGSVGDHGPHGSIMLQPTNQPTNQLIMSKRI